MIDLRKGDCLEIMKNMPDNSVDMVITSPPYFNLRDYGVAGQIGQENSKEEYLDNLIKVFDEVYRILKNEGSCWVNIDDTYSKGNHNTLLCIPDLFKIKMVERGWLCRNEIIWHKPNAMPSSAKTRFNNDYEKLFFFTKKKNYYFETQYEPLKTVVAKNTTAVAKNTCSKYKNTKQEASVRQGMNKERGTKIIALRKDLPTQKIFVDFMRNKTTISQLCENTSLSKTKIEHWFRRDKEGFAFPSVEDWNEIKWLLDDFSEEFYEIDKRLNEITYETDDILKNVSKGRLKRCVWAINTKPFKGYHYAPYPEELVLTPIKACCPENGIVLDPFMGSGTTGVACKKLNRGFVGIDINEDFIEIAKKRIEDVS